MHCMHVKCIMSNQCVRLRAEKPRFLQFFKVFSVIRFYFTKTTRQKITTHEEHPIDQSIYHIVCYKL